MTVMNKANKIRMLKQRFRALNPGVGVDVIDWNAEVGKKESFSEALQDLRYANPQYRWMKNKRANYDSQVVGGLRSQAKEYGYTLIKSGERHRLTRAAKLPTKRGVKAPSKKPVYEFVRAYDRGWPGLKHLHEKPKMNRVRRRGR